MAESIISAFVAEQKELLALELQADEDSNNNRSEEEQDDNEQRSSHVLGSLEASDVSVGLYGRTVVQLTLFSTVAENTTSTTTAAAADKSSNLLPAHRLTVGDEVEIRSKHKPSKKGFPGGVISEVSDTHVFVALFQKQSATSGSSKSNNNNNNNNDDHDDGDDTGSNAFGTPPLTLVPRSSVEVHRKLLHALSVLEKEGIDHPIAGRVVQSMFVPQDFPPPPPASPSWQPFNTRLDASQQDAIAFGLSQQGDRPIALIHGPPGTGKTTTVTELIQQAVHVHKLKVLVTAPSNVAVDNVLERLVSAAATSTTTTHNKKDSRKASQKIRAVRLGHPARLKSSLLPYSLEALVQSSDGTEIVADVRKELQSYLKILSNPKSRGSDKRIAYRELKSLRQEIRTREEKLVQELIDSAQVVLATTVGAANRILGRVEGGFDLVVIDEAAQALEASCWIPILMGKRVILAGDHCQLPPTIKSKHTRAQKGLGITMFERLMQLYGDDQKATDDDRGTPPKISRMLNVQYRMHEQIANWASTAMYHGQLETHESVQKRTLSQLQGITTPSEENDDSNISNAPLLLIDTAGCDMHELVNAAGSRYNPGEARLVTRRVQTLIGMGLKPQQMCVITPYNGQVEYLRNLLLGDYPTLEIRSVDGFQGGEREAVILSLVRSSERGGKDGIGFLKDNRRQNVAVTRAKRHLAVICDSETVSQSNFISTLIAWIEEHGEQRSAMEYEDTNYNPDEQDLQAAEAEIMKIVEAAVPEKTKKTEPSKAAPAPNMGPEARQRLMDQIAAFAKSATPGEEMILSTALTSYDRRLVHEFADQIGMGHRSEGVDGRDRRIVVKKEEKLLDPIVSAEDAPSAEDFPVAIESVTDKEEKFDKSPSGQMTFSTLNLYDSDDSESEKDGMSSPPAVAENDETITSKEEASAPNSLLSTLAKERKDRQQARPVAPEPSSKSKKKNKGQKLGGTKQTKQKRDERLDGLDDVAFLDSQIEKAQNAHGRKVAGSGQGYRTIVNGILNARPEPPSKPSNTKAAASLQSKLKEAQNGRKAKTTSKKKKK